MKIDTKIRLTCSLFIALLLIVAVVCYIRLHHIENDVEEAFDHAEPMVKNALEIELNVVKQGGIVAEYMSHPSPALKKNFEKSAHAVEVSLNTIESKTCQDDTTEMGLLDDLKKKIEVVETHGKKLLKHVDEDKIDVALEDFKHFRAELEDLDEFVHEAFLEHYEAIMEHDVEEIHHLVASSITIVSALAIVGLVAGVTMYFLLSKSILKPLKQLVSSVDAVSKGDLTQKIQVETKDELGEVAEAVNGMVDDLNALVKNLLGNIRKLELGSSELTMASQELSSTAEEISSQAESIMGSGEALSSSTDTMATNANQINASANTVASGIEEMSASINEVAQNCSKESQIATEANDMAQNNRQLMTELGDAAQEVGNVVELINSIADQTNLLALNATIEAASAGEAGKGFAVVANEVKQLARQTAEATEQISKQICEIQSKTQSTVDSNEKVGGIIEQINQISQTVAAAVEEQSATSNEISNTMSEVSVSTQTMADSINESTNAAKEVSSNVAGFREAASRAAASATETNSSANELSLMAKELKKAVDVFKV